MNAVLKLNISATEISNSRKRLQALPRHFGKHMMRFESAVYAFADRLCDAYNGAFWNFYELSNGGFYMAPNSGAFHVSTENQFSGDMSADAFGITTCLYVLSNLACTTQAESLTEHYDLLLDFARVHEEHRAISAAIN